MRGHLCGARPPFGGVGHGIPQAIDRNGDSSLLHPKRDADARAAHESVGVFRNGVARASTHAAFLAGPSERRKLEADRRGQKISATSGRSETDIIRILASRTGGIARHT